MRTELLHILQHSLGCDKYGQGTMYRNRFVTGEGTVGWPLCGELVSLGLMQDHGPQKIAGGMHCFSVTDAGIKAMKDSSSSPPKITRGQRRYQEWLKVADIGWTFGEWLKWKSRQAKA